MGVCQRGAHASTGAGDEALSPDMGAGGGNAHRSPGHLGISGGAAFVIGFAVGFEHQGLGVLSAGPRIPADWLPFRGRLRSVFRPAGGLNSHMISRIPRKACNTVRALASWRALISHRPISISSASRTAGRSEDGDAGSGPRSDPAHRSMASAILAMGESAWAWRTTGSLANRIESASINIRAAIRASEAEFRACWRLNARASSTVSGAGRLGSSRFRSIGGRVVPGRHGRRRVGNLASRTARVRRAGLAS